MRNKRTGEQGISSYELFIGTLSRRSSTSYWCSYRSVVR